MKKRVLLLICVLALLAGCLVMSSMAATTKTGPCRACGGKTVTWEPIVFGRHAVSAGSHKHYYFDQSYNHGTANKQIVIPGNNMTVCIDLNGKTWYNGTRAFCASNSGTTAAPVGCTINIMDSVGGAIVTSRSENTGSAVSNSAGGGLYVDYGCTMNIYGGTFKVDALDSRYGMNTKNGGLAAVMPSGTLNVHGGALVGAPIRGKGGTVYLYSEGSGGHGATLNVSGGILKAGLSGTGIGNCVDFGKGDGTVTLAGCKVTLSGNAYVDDIYMPVTDTNKLLFSGAFTGSVNLSFPDNSGLKAGSKVAGAINSCDVSGADIYCTVGTGYGATISGSYVQLAAASTGVVRQKCPHCNAYAVWEPFTGNAPTAAGFYHYYLNANYTTAGTKQISFPAGTQVCLDLYGHTYETIGRAFDCTAANVTLSILDSVGGGAVNTYGGNNNPGGGVIIVGTSSIFDLHSGTLKFVHTPANSTNWGGTARGGVIQSSGTVNVYGGKIVGGDVVDTSYEYTGIEGAGGAIYHNGKLNLLGGEITMGSAPASGAGPCIYVTDAAAKTVLGGAAKVADIYFAKNDTSTFIVNSDFTGTAAVSYDSSVTLTQGAVIATFYGTTLNGTVTYGEYNALASDGMLKLSAYPAGSVAATGSTGYKTLQEAINAAASGALVELIESVSGNVTVNKNITLQLNNCSIDGTVTVAKNCTLYGMDSATDDYSVADGEYGKITKVAGEGNVTGAIVDGGVAENCYLKVTETAGVSFHCVTLDIQSMVLRADDAGQPGLYYKSNFKADEKAAPLIASYGVALSAKAVPTLKNLSTDCRCSVITGFESGAMGNMGQNSSTLLTGILKNRNTDSVNTRNLNTQVYGRGYALTTDGQYLLGRAVSRNLAEQLTAVDKVVSGLSETQTSTVVSIYKKFKTVLSSLSLTNIANAVQTNEEGTLKILVLGNSHSLDATNLLYEVFHNEAPNQKVIIGALYYSGCRMWQHEDFITGNQKVYTYHKNDGTQTNRAWVVKSATCLDALQDEQWDYIFMQQMNHRLAMDSEFEGWPESWKIVADYLLNNQDITPKLGFHITWTNPDNYELYLNDNAPYHHASAEYWRTTHEQAWPDANGKYDKSLQWADTVACVKKYLIDDTSLVGRPYDLFLPSGAAIEYAENVCGRPQQELYRDYTHMNDYGRLITAYVWYAQIMGLEQLPSTIKTTAIPAALKHANSLFPAKDSSGNYTVTADMQADLIESVNWALKNPLGIPVAK